MRYLFLISFLITSTWANAQAIRLIGDWKFHIGDNPQWSDKAYNDSKWEKIYAPSPWEDEGFNGYDGFAWYRRKFDGKELSQEENYYLSLGYIDDADEVYVNGMLIGLSGSMPPKFKTAYNSERKYALPNDILNFSGENVIAVRVYDVTLAGGIVDGPLGIYRTPRSRMLMDLRGLWDFQTEDGEWKKVMVPSPWEHQGFPHYDGDAKYKRTFVADDRLFTQDEDIFLVLGKIDDFDKTYLNGRLIGKTNDGGYYGQSDSYQKVRLYKIPAELLKKGVNTIEIEVYDMGNVGGIYEGPVGILTRTAYERYYR